MSSKATFVATGDTFITRRLPERGYPGYQELCEFIKKHEVRFTNLETTVHNREGYPFGFSGGTWGMSCLEVLDDLKNGYGFNLYNAANNHSMDYSHNGLVRTMEYLEERGMLYAGVGRNLADASAPVYLECEHARVALVAATSSFHESWAAGNQRFDMMGRPGVNPLRFQTIYHVEQKFYEALQKVADSTGINEQHNLNVKEGFDVEKEGFLRFGSSEFKAGNENKKQTIPNAKDLDRITRNIVEAKKQSDFVMVSIHSHELGMGRKDYPAEFYQEFCRKCIDAGASVILGHGPHLLRGIELYNGGVIFYSIGNFLFENDTITHLPADFYEKYSMHDESFVGDGMDNRSKNGTIGLGVDPEVWRSVIPTWTMEDGKITEVKLFPIDLHMELPRYRRGLPELTENTAVLDHLAELCQPFGTKITIANGIGTIELK